jgi:hypothetical protein
LPHIVPYDDIATIAPIGAGDSQVFRTVLIEKLCALWYRRRLGFTNRRTLGFRTWLGFTNINGAAVP